MYKSSKKKLPNNITVEVVSAHRWTNVMVNLLALILHDYKKRFNTRILRKKFHVSIALVNYANDPLSGEIGCTTLLDDGSHIFVQVHDPYLAGELEEEHSYVNCTFLNTIAHELVHVCQHLTHRDESLTSEAFEEEQGMLKMNTLPGDLDKYYFDPIEVEARMLADYYTNLFAVPLLKEHNEENSI